jgi:tellurite methyltransferase
VTQRSTRPEDSATAYEAWDRQFGNPEQRRHWQEPDLQVREIVPLLRERGVTEVLDLGCGVGRHLLYLAQQGFTVTGVDASPTGIDEVRRGAQSLGLHPELRVASFLELPFPDARFGYVLAWNVIYHGDGRVVAAVLDEVRRVLTPDGLYQATMLSKRNSGFGKGREIAPDTFVDPTRSEEKAHPHFYCDAADLLSLHSGFEVLTLLDCQQGPVAWHWEFVMERAPGAFEEASTVETGPR